MQAAPPFSFADTQAQLTDLSTGLAALPANGISTVQYGGMTFEGDGTNAAQIFNVNGSDLMDVSYANSST